MEHFELTACDRFASEKHDDTDSIAFVRHKLKLAAVGIGVVRSVSCTPSRVRSMHTANLVSAWHCRCGQIYKVPSLQAPGRQQRLELRVGLSCLVRKFQGAAALLAWYVCCGRRVLTRHFHISAWPGLATY